MGKTLPVSLYGGAYKAPNVLADAQECINLFVENNLSPQAAFPATHYPTPGLKLLATPPVSAGQRCQYRATNGDLYVVVGPNVYFVDVTFSYTLLGTINDLITPVSMADNGTDIMIVDGSEDGWTVNLSTKAFAQIVDPAFYGSPHVDYIDGFFILSQPNSRNFYISLFNSTSFDGLDIVSKTGGPDNVQAVWVMQREVWVIGTLTTEIWYNAGDANFPLAAVPGAFLDHGTCAVYSISKFGDKLFWLHQDKTGYGTVAISEGYGAKKCSSYGIDDKIQKYLVVSDAVGFCYQLGGHAFYQLTFPNADVTWVYDQATDQWHRRATIDGNGVLHRHRAYTGTFAYGKNLVGDFQNGKIYEQSRTTYLDDDMPIIRLRSLPHFIKNGGMVDYIFLALNIETGTLPSPTGQDPLITLRWSDDGGKSWGNGVQQTLGNAGETRQQVIWNNLGQARDRVFELSWEINANCVFNAVYLNAEPVIE